MDGERVNELLCEGAAVMNVAIPRATAARAAVRKDGAERS